MKTLFAIIFFLLLPILIAFIVLGYLRIIEWLFQVLGVWK